MEEDTSSSSCDESDTDSCEECKNIATTYQVIRLDLISFSMHLIQVRERVLKGKINDISEDFVRWIDETLYKIDFIDNQIKDNNI